MLVQLVKNGDFSSSEDWTLGDGWSISGGEGIFSYVSEAGSLEQTIDISTDKRYHLTFEVISISLSGTSYLQGSLGEVVTTHITEPGYYGIAVEPGSVTTLKFEILGSGGQSGDEAKIDNVSVICQEGITPLYAVKSYTDSDRTVTKIVKPSEIQG